MQQTIQAVPGPARSTRPAFVAEWLGMNLGRKKRALELAGPGGSVAMRRYLSLSLLALTALCTGCLRDLRPSDARSEIDTASAERGRALLRQSAEAHGVDAWSEYRTTTVRMRDDWDSMMASMMGMTPPWDVEELIDFSWINGTFDGAFRFANGEREGEALGLQAWNSYEGTAGHEVFHDEEDQDGDARFMVPAFIYLLELPFRIADVPVVRDLGDAELFGRTHHRVYASWSNEPSSDHDQFVVHIDAETHLVRMVEYTIRDQFNFVRGTSTYSQHIRVRGVTVPTRMAVNIRPRENHDERYSHRAVLWNWAFDAVDELALLPGTDRGGSQDAKPVDTH
ncbi:MAG: hypothetical protein ACI9KE_000572 [Polyangiales bacterium]|jgi:hypothetical protein